MVINGEIREAHRDNCIIYTIQCYPFKALLICTYFKGRNQLILSNKVMEQYQIHTFLVLLLIIAHI